MANGNFFRGYYGWGFNDNNGIIVGLMRILMGILSDIVPMGYGE